MNGSRRTRRSSVKPGDLRRFHHNAFIADSQGFNGACFVPLEWRTIHFVDILIGGEISRSWEYRFLICNSEPLDEVG